MKASVGDEVVKRLGNFAEALKSKQVISEQFTCRRVVLNLNPTPYDPKLVRETRSILGASQAMFARFLGVKRKTVQSWEQGQVCRVTWHAGSWTRSEGILHTGWIASKAP